MQKSIKEVKAALATSRGLPILIDGWAKTKRESKGLTFVEVSDGTCLKGIQVIIHTDFPDYENVVKSITTGCSLRVVGKVIDSPGKEQGYEINATRVDIIGTCPSDYPMQKKGHTNEFLRTQPHLRLRTNTLAAVMRVRNACATAIHQYFHKEGFLWATTPILTASDAEGAGDMFSVESTGTETFFGKPAYLTVSGQLEAEAFATAFRNVYTFAPTFRAEKSKTTRHLSEFWMVEPEMSFCDLQTMSGVAEEFIKYVISYVLNNHKEDMQFFNQWIDKELIARLESVVAEPFARVTYTEAVELLLASKQKFEFLPKWGNDLQTEHERYLAEKHFNKPVVVTNYPEGIKSFYMRANGDGTVAAMDILVPKIGEIIGGSQREEREDVLRAKMESLKMPTDEYEWYLDLRKYGSVPHAGFGLGFERLVQYVTGMSNIREVIAFPRSVGEI